MSGQVVPLYAWVQHEPNPSADLTLTIELTPDGPVLSIAGRPATAEDLTTAGRALVDAGRAVRNGDDPAEVVKVEWQRRRSHRPKKPC